MKNTEESKLHDDDELDLIENKTCRVYKKSRGTKYDIYLSHSIEVYEAGYLEVLRICEEATENDSILFHLANFGGSCHQGFRICSVIRACKAATYAIVEAPCYSMGAIIALAPKHLVIYNGTFLMFHNFSGESGGKGGEMALSVGEYAKHFKFQITDLCSPFLTSKEIEGIHQDRDVYIHAEETGLTKRLLRHEKKRNA